MELVRVSLWLVFLERVDLDLAEPDEPKIPLTIEPRSPPVFFLVVFFVPRKESTIEPNIFSHSGSSFLRLLLAVPEDAVLVVVVLVVVVLVVTVLFLREAVFFFLATRSNMVRLSELSPVPADPTVFFLY